MADNRGAPYVFISYSHENAKLVLSIIESIVDNGYAVWYDKSIDISSTWTDNIGRAIIECEVVVAFISKESVASKYVRNEIEFALSKNKRIIPVYLDGMEILPPGLALGLNATQGVVGKKEVSEIAKQICAGLEFNAVQRERDAFERGKRKKTPALAKVAAVVCALTLICGGGYFFVKSVFRNAYEITLDKQIYLPAERIAARIAEVTPEMIVSRAVIGVWDKDERNVSPYKSYKLLSDPPPLLRAPIETGEYEVRVYASYISESSDEPKSAAAFSVAKDSLGAFEISLVEDECVSEAEIHVNVKGVSQKMIDDRPIVGLYRVSAPHDGHIEYVPVRSEQGLLWFNCPLNEGEYEIRAYSNSDVWEAETLVASVKFLAVKQ